MKVHGIGKAKAKDLHDKYKCRSIKDLRALVNKSSVYNFSNDSRIGLKHFDDLQVINTSFSHALG